MRELVLIRGAGEMASAVAHRLFRSGFPVIMLELPQPLAVRRMVSFAQAMYTGSHEVEGVRGECCARAGEALSLVQKAIPVVPVEKEGELMLYHSPPVLIEATLRKTSNGVRLDQAPLVIGLGPGYRAGRDVHCVIETQRGHDLGRLYYEGQAHADTGIPGDIAGYTHERVCRAPREGPFVTSRSIGQRIEEGEEFARVAGEVIRAGVSGVIRGLLYPGIQVDSGCKVGDIDPRGKAEYCFTISDKARTIAGSVLEAILHTGKEQ